MPVASASSCSSAGASIAPPASPAPAAARLYAEHVAGRVISLSLPLPAVRFQTVGILSADPSWTPGTGNPASADQRGGQSPR